MLVSCPDPTHYARKGMVTFEGFLGCAHPHVLIQQARDLHVRIHFVYKIFTVSACREPVYVCVASLFSVLLINCQRSQISRSDQGRSDNGVLRMRKCVLIINLYTIRRECHMIAESAQPRNPSNVTRPFLA